MDNIYCDGFEDDLTRCRFDGWGQSDCKSTEAAGVICQEEPEEELPIKDEEQKQREPVLYVVVYMFIAFTL